MVKQAIKAAFNRCGLEVRRLTENPKHNLLGLRDLKIRTVVDAGANEGQFARFITTALPGVRVYSFEPLPGPFAKLKKWADSLPQRNVVPFNVGLGTEACGVEMFEHVELTGHSSLLQTSDLSHSLYPQTKQQRSVRVEISRLDDMLDNGAISLNPETLFKLDVQGYEDRVLRGASKVLSKSRACLLEVNLEPLYESQATFEGLFQILIGAGYRYAGCFSQGYHANGRVIGGDALFVRY